MSDGEWRERLKAAWKRSRKSMRSVSLKAGVAGGYLHDLLSTDKEPTIGNMVAICDQLGVSVTWVLFGIEMSGDAERLLRLYANLPENRQKALLDLAESARKLSDT